MRGYNFHAFLKIQAYWINFQLTAKPLYGGILLPIAIGAVVDGVPTTSQTPLSGQFSPVLANVPNGTLVFNMSLNINNFRICISSGSSYSRRDISSELAIFDLL